MNNKSSSSPDDKLDRLLQNWAAEQAPADEVLDALCQRVLSTADQAKDQSVQVVPYRPTPAPLHSRAPRYLFWLAVAASLMVVALVWNRGADPKQVPALAKTNARTRQDFTKQKQVMQKLLSIYDQPLVWVAESPDAVQVELAQTPEQVDDQQPWLLIRLTVEPQRMETTTSRLGEQSEAEPVWQMDLLVRSEQRVDLSGGENLDEQLMVWPYMTEDGLVMIDTQFAGLGPMTTAGNQSNLVRPGSRTYLTSVNNEYAVCQYVDVIY